MKFLEDAILEKGKIIDNDIIKVDSFINHQIDPKVTNAVADYFVEEFKGMKIDKVLTIETSGLPIAYAVADRLNVLMVFAKKSKSRTVDNNIYSADVLSFTRGTMSVISVSKDYILKNENILIQVFSLLFSDIFSFSEASFISLISTILESFDFLLRIIFRYTAIAQIIAKATSTIIPNHIEVTIRHLPLVSHQFYLYFLR